MTFKNKNHFSLSWGSIKQNQLHIFLKKQHTSWEITILFCPVRHILRVGQDKNVSDRTKLCWFHPWRTEKYCKYTIQDNYVIEFTLTLTIDAFSLISIPIQKLSHLNCPVRHVGPCPKHSEFILTPLGTLRVKKQFFFWNLPMI